MVQPVTPAGITAEQLLAIPFDEVVAVLRGLIDELVPQILRVQGRSTPTLMGLLQRQPLQVLFRKTMADPNSRDGLTQRGQPGQQSDDTTNRSFFDQHIASFIQSGQLGSQLNQAFTNRELASLTFMGYELIPVMYWPLAANAAWCDGEFQFRVGYLARQYLRQTEFLTPIEPSLPSFSPNVFWILLLLLPENTHAGPGGQLFQRGGKIDSSTVPDLPLIWIQRAEKTLRSVANIAAATPGWAGFWDQWLITQAIRVWKPSLASDMLGMFHALLNLPVVNEQLPEETTAYETRLNLKGSPPFNLARPEVQTERPGWYRSKRAPKTPSNEGR
jgi:hypothetical protein